MMRVRLFAICTAAALVAAPFHSGVALTHPPGATAGVDGSVLSLGIRPATGSADVVIGVSGAPQVSDFTMSDPNRIVIDFTNATLGLVPSGSYDGVARGPVKNIRYSQFLPTVVRITITVDNTEHYRLSQTGGEVHVAIDGAANFNAWAAQSVGRQPAIAADSLAMPARNADNAKAPPMQQSTQRHTTMVFVDEPINDVIQQFRDFSGRNILIGKGVSGTITNQFQDLPWDVGLQEVLRAAGFDATQSANGVLTVEPMDQIAQRLAAQQASEPLVTTTVSLNYQNPIAVQNMVVSRLSHDCSHSAGAAAATSDLSGGQAAPAPMANNASCPLRAGAAATADTLTKSISITDVQSSVTTLTQYVRSLDRRPAQVDIHAKIILVDRSTLDGLGLRYDIGSPNQFFNEIIPRLDSTGTPLTADVVNLGGNTISAIANATQRIPSAALQLVFSTAFGAFNATTFLEALRTTNLLDVQAEPNGQTLNNRTVNLTAGTDVPLRTIDPGAGGTAGGTFPRATVAIHSTGVILTVTPQVTNNGMVLMTVHVENSDVTFSGGDAASFPKQSVDNTVLVADGETAVMGGLTETTVNTTRSGIPILSDLPLIGKLFGVTQHTETKRDLLILITPHITDTGDQPVPGAGAGGGHE